MSTRQLQLIGPHFLAFPFSPTRRDTKIKKKKNNKNKKSTANASFAGEILEVKVRERERAREPPNAESWVALGGGTKGAKTKDRIKEKSELTEEKQMVIYRSARKSR